MLMVREDPFHLMRKLYSINKMEINNKIYDKITIIIVLYNSTELVLECLKAIKNFKIIIVDNGKNKRILKIIKENYFIEKIVTLKKNLGFGVGINSGVSFVKTDFFLMLNPDAIISLETINKLYTTSVENNATASAPWVRDDSSCYGLFPESSKGVRRSKNEINSAKILDNYKPEGNCCVQVHKCCALLVSKKEFIHIGMFNPKYFLFWEEIDLCRKFRNNKLSLILNPECEMIHQQGNSVNNSIYTYFIKTFNTEYSPFIYFDIKKNSKFLYWRLIKYAFRSVCYLGILNVKNSFKNIIKFTAIIYFIFKSK